MVHFRSQVDNGVMVAVGADGGHSGGRVLRDEADLIRLAYGARPVYMTWREAGPPDMT